MVKNLVIAALSIALLVLIGLVLRKPAPLPEPVVKVATPDPVPAPPVEPESLKPEPDPVPAPDPRLVAIEAALDAGEAMPGMQGAVLGFCLIGPDGETLYERRGDLAQIPASTLKTLTTATALRSRRGAHVGVPAAEAYEG
jgi:hypothetical protein